MVLETANFENLNLFLLSCLGKDTANELLCSRMTLLIVFPSRQGGEGGRVHASRPLPLTQ